MAVFTVTGMVAFISGAISVFLAIIVVLLEKPSQKELEVLRPASAPWLLRAPLLPLVFAVLAALLSIYSLILRFAFGAENFLLPKTANVTSPVLVAATLVAGALTAAYAVLRLRAHLLAEVKSRLEVHGNERADEKHQIEQEVVFTERFAKAVALLADPQPISRIAGSHLIFALGDEWRSDGAQQRCLDVLVSHLRVLCENELFEDEPGSRGIREEVRLITSEILRRLSKGAPSWNVRVGDFRGTVVADFHIDDDVVFPLLDLRGAKVLGDLRIPSLACSTAPKLTDIVCEGCLTIAWRDGWGEMDLSGAKLGASVSLIGKTLSGNLIANEICVEGDFDFGFELFEGDVIFDSAKIKGDLVVGSPELGAMFGTKVKSTELSLVGSSFRELKLRHCSQGPQLNLAGSVGAIDLSYSTFPLEVTANQLDASAGFRLQGTQFLDAFVLEGAILPETIDINGLVMSEKARSAVRSSDFASRELLLGDRKEKVSSYNLEKDVQFDWRPLLESLGETIGDPLKREVESRLTKIENILPVDWNRRQSFTALLMTEVSRAAAKSNASKSEEETMQTALKRSLGLAPIEGESR